MEKDLDDVSICIEDGDTYFKYGNKVYGFSGIETDPEEIKSIALKLRIGGYFTTSLDSEVTWLNIYEYILLGC